MASSTVIPLAVACILALALASVQSSAILNLDNLPEDGTVTTPATEDNNENMLTGFQTTEYAIVDFAKIGYELFKEKLFKALSMLDTFMHMKPMVIKITKTYICCNDTNPTNETNTDDLSMIGGGNDLSHETQVEDPKDNDLHELGTNTEVAESSKLDKETLHSNEVGDHLKKDLSRKHYDADIPSSTRKIQDNDNMDVQKSTLENQGFFGRVISGIGNFFHSIWHWLT